MRRVRRIHPALAVLLVLTALQGIAWTVATAPLNGPDEDSHFAYVQHLAETGDGPDRVSGEQALSTEVRNLTGGLGLYAIVGHLEARPNRQAIPRLERELGELPPEAREDGDGPNPAGNYPPLYYAAGAVAYHLSPDDSLLARISAVRLAGVLMWVVTVGLVWLLAAELFRRTWPRVVMTGLVALQPKLGFIAAIVNPDIALVLETTALLLVGTRIVKRGPTAGRVLGIALIAGAGVLTHGRGLALVPPAGVAVLIGAARFWPGWRRFLLPAVPAAALLLVAGLAAVAYTRSHSTGGAFGGQAAIQSGFSVRELIGQVWQFYFPRLAEMAPRPGPPYGYRQVFIETYYGVFGSLEVNYRPGTNDALQVASALGLAGLWSAALLRGRRVLQEWPAIVFGAAVLLTMMALLHVVSYQGLRNGGQDPIITGRYLLPCVALYGGAAAFVCSSLGRRAGPVLGAVLLASSATLALGGLTATLVRFHG